MTKKKRLNTFVSFQNKDFNLIKDIHIPQSIGLKLAIVPISESNWDLFLINTNEHSLQNILLVTEGKDEAVQSSKLRYFLESMMPKSYIKFETLFDDVAKLRNTITVTYYIGMDIYEKEFSFQLSALTTLENIEILEKEGFLIN